MKKSSYLKRIIISFCLIFLIVPNLQAQTKKLKRPKGRVGISSVDNFVRESFDLYDKVYRYDGYAAAGTPLEDEDIDVLEDALDDLSGLTNSAPDIIDDLDGSGILKQGKATLQINRAKKALKYSVKTAKELLLGQRDRDSEDDKEDNSSNDEETDESSDSNNDTNENAETNDSTEEAAEEVSNVSDGLEVYSKYDFVPGDKLIFYDDFSADFIGDFPSKWNTNGSGEVVKTNNAEGNWFEIKPGYRIFYIPDIKGLTEDYTIEFDLLTSGLSRKTSSTARLYIILSDTDKFLNGKDHHTQVSLPFGQYSNFDIRCSNYFNRGAGDINSNIRTDVRDEMKNQPHISISVTKKRFRLWVNAKKYVDIPRFIQELNVLNYLKFNINQLKDGEERIFIKNLKVAEGGEDLRRKLIREGKVSTNGILFDSGSANIQPKSLGIVRQISQVLMQDASIKLNIIGHTDADGTNEGNLKLSKSRADAVKEVLTSIYKISADRLKTDGKGESQPIGDNKTVEGKAQNRRVEFVKL
jgi:outer membrane protein OmpA-like peptidoglycan-associated protein